MKILFIESGLNALNAAFDRKMKQAGEACREAGIEFIPLPVETMGGWHPHAFSTITKLCHQLARQVGKEDQEVVPHTFQRLGISLMRSNAALLLARIPHHTPNNMVGD